MMRVIALLLLLAVGLAGCGQTQAVREKRAVNAILNSGGHVTRDENLPGRPVVFVFFYDSKVTDADLKALKELKGLKELRLWATQITDAGLEALKELTGLRVLDLSSTPITDADLKEKGTQEFA